MQDEPRRRVGRPRRQDHFPRFGTVQILPKPTILSNQDLACPRSISRTALALHNTRQVPLCSIPDCQLWSHHHYQPWKPRTSRESSASSTSLQTTQALRTPSGDSDDGLDLWIVQGGVNGMPGLPLDGLTAPVWQELFHQFFNHDLDKNFIVVVPPPVSEIQKGIIIKTKHNVLLHSLSDSLSCHNVIAIAHCKTLFRRGALKYDPITTILSAKLTGLLRKKLDHFIKDDITQLINAITTLAVLEIVGGNTTCLTEHRSAMQHLVMCRGGLDYMEEVTPFVLILDRIISIFTGVPTCFAQKSNRIIRRPSPHPHVYGSGFESWLCTHDDGESIRDYCIDVCRVIELLEVEKWTFDPLLQTQISRSDLEYVYFVKESLNNDFVMLNSYLADDESIYRCVLLAAKIVDYTVLFDNIFAIMPLHLAGIIRPILSKLIDESDLLIFDDILTWILFVLATMSIKWDGHRWVLHILAKQLTMKYSGKSWPVSWKVSELHNVTKFVWSHTRLQKSFMQTCDELQLLCATNEGI